MPKLVNSSWYIVNRVWVKNVNKLRKDDSKACDVLSTNDLHLKQYTSKGSVKVDVILKFNHYFLAIISTTKICLLYLSKWTYTHYPHPLLLERLKKN